MLIKAVAKAIPTYTMSVFKLPNDLCSSIQSSINDFWWGHNKDGRKIHWVYSAKLQNRKDDSGLGFRDLETFNDVLLVQQLRQLMTQPHSVPSRVLKAKCFPGCLIWDVGLDH